MKSSIKLSWALLFLLTVTLVSSCKKDDPEAAVIASFTFQVDATDFMKVAFTSESQNFQSLSWDFGDNSAASTEANPVHTYAATGQYTVKLTATSPAGVKDVYSETITIADPNEYLTRLVGDVSKTWKLVREGSPTAVYYPFTVGELNPDGTRKGIWWQYGKNAELAERPCTLNDEYTFTRVGLSFNRDMKGDFWAGDGGIYSAPVEFSCQDVGATGTTTNKEGVDISAWRDMTGTFVLTSGTPSTLKIVGNGAYIGLEKVATHEEVKVPQAEVTYEIAKLVDGTIDTLVIVANYDYDDDPEMDAYWEFVLVHYDNPADEPPIPANKPSAGFTMEQNGLTITLTNTTTGGDSYLWEFGDGTTSTEMNPVHTYATEGIYDVVLTATNANGSSSASTGAFITATELTDALLQGGAWKVRPEEKSVFVGPGLGNASWWALPKSNLTTGTGTDDWTCLADDEFTFTAGGVYTYDTKGSARNDGYFGGTNGCIDDATIATSGNGAAFGSATHSYVLTPAGKSMNARAVITLTNGATGAAFVGFYKGYYGGENMDGANAPNGGASTNVYEVMGYANTGFKEYLFISVDISADHSGSAAWSVILER
jgi:PKD repeat protein